jgi:uncharacterized protein YacL
MKNIILKTIGYIMGILFIFSVSALDSESNIPYIVCIVSAAYLALFAYANNVFFWQQEDEE